MMSLSTNWKAGCIAAAILLFSLPAKAEPSQFSAPWRQADRALVVDAYEYNPIDWKALAKDKRIVGFIGKASDGLPPPYSCTGNETEIRLCKALFRRHAVARELFHTRRMAAKSIGLKWGAYHLARPGNPIDQANNFIDFADPEPDDLLAIDIEDNDPEKWMSLSDAEEFVRHIQRRIGRFPILYTNGSTAKYIADNHELYPLLSRLPLWYARYKPEIGEHFPKGNWHSYTLWQFASQANCNNRHCPYRVSGTDTDIDVNVASMNADELRRAWPFGGLLDVPVDMIASLPIPIGRDAGLAGNSTLAYAQVEKAPAAKAIEAALHPEANKQALLYEAATAMPEIERSLFKTFTSYVAGLKDNVLTWFDDETTAPAGIDPITTATIPRKADPDDSDTH